MSRGLAYWNDETIALIKKHFVAVSVPTWVARAEGPEGEFFRSAGIDKKWVTSSGYMHCVSASGKLLGGRASEKVLEAFKQLPESERAPGAVKVPDIDRSEALIPSPPEGGLVLKVHARFLDGEYGKEIRHAKTEDFPLMADKPKVRERWRLFLEPNTEYMWLTREEWRKLVPRSPVKDQRIEVDPSIAHRMARFHLTPKRATTSEGGIVHSKNVRTTNLELIVDTVTPKSITMHLQGYVHWGTDFDAEQARTPNGPLMMGYATPIYGRLEFDRAEQEFARFDIVAPGHVWGRWGDANRKSMYVERPGKTPFSFAFELATGDSPTERIPPGGNGRYVTGKRGYFTDAR